MIREQRDGMWDETRLKRESLDSIECEQILTPVPLVTVSLVTVPYTIILPVPQLFQLIPLYSSNTIAIVTSTLFHTIDKQKRFFYQIQ
jgi:hypothetical protein